MKYKAESVLPYDENEKKSSQIRHMFDVIAGTYDRLNRIMTMGIDRLWRRKAIDEVGLYCPETILDVATGTGDLALLMNRRLKPLKITGIDISEGMLDVARHKVAMKDLDGIIEFDVQDCLNMSFRDNQFNAVTVAFGVRNFEDFEKGFSEMYRVLTPGGVLMVLELSTPEYPVIKQLYKFYTYSFIPFMGRLLTKDGKAYTYLPRSVAVVPQGEQMLSVFRSVGFKNVRCRKLTFGACSIYLGEK